MFKAICVMNFVLASPVPGVDMEIIKIKASILHARTLFAAKQFREVPFLSLKISTIQKIMIFLVHMLLFVS
jgi:hypothetical protein